MQKSGLVTCVLIWCIWCSGCATIPLSRVSTMRVGDGDAVKDLASDEPSCEQLKAMWRFSKRQSRAAEFTNEIPMYRDPFTENVWEPYYPTSRSIGGMRMGRFRERPTIYGRVIHKAPILRIQDPVERNRAFEALTKIYADPRQQEPRRRMTAFRLSGGGHMSPMDVTPQSGSFQHLKEIIRSERARELQEQRMAEEMAARAAAIQELNGNNRGQSSSFRDLSYNYDPTEHEEQQENYGGHGGIVAFPDLLAPAARMETDAGYMPDYGYSRERPRSHTSPYFDTSSFNNEMDSMML